MVAKIVVTLILQHYKHWNSIYTVVMAWNFVTKISTKETLTKKEEKLDKERRENVLKVEEHYQISFKGENRSLGDGG